MTLLSRAVLAVLLAALACLPWTAREARADTEREVSAVIEYLRQKDPEIVLQAVQAWWDEQEEYRQQQQVGRIAANWEALARAGGDPAIGPEDADAVLVEFFDYRCGFCKRVLDDVMALAAADGRLRIVFKEFPILGPESEYAARAALAVRNQGKYAAFHWALMGLRGALDQATVKQVAESVGVDVARMEQDMDAPEIAETIRRSYQLAEALNINGTPAFVVGNEIVRGAISAETLSALIAEARAGT